MEKPRLYISLLTPLSYVCVRLTFPEPPVYLVDVVGVEVDVVDAFTRENPRLMGSAEAGVRNLKNGECPECMVSGNDAYRPSFAQARSIVRRLTFPLGSCLISSRSSDSSL